MTFFLDPQGTLVTGTKTKPVTVKSISETRVVTTKNLVIHDDIHMTFSDFVIDHTASMTNC
jgi:hypothetical protein